MNDLISIVVPAYNHDKYVEFALNSIAKQTYHNKELIIIDDCSRDKTKDIIEKFINDNTVKNSFPGGIKFIKHNVNRNANATINEGINLANGKFISIINSDDAYQENRLEVFMNILKKNESRFAFSKVKVIMENNKVVEHEKFEAMQKQLEKFPLINFSLAIENGAIGTGNFIFDKKLFYELDGFDTNYHFIHDWDFLLRATFLTKIYYTKETTYFYRFHCNNTIKQIEQNDRNRIKKDREVYNVLKNFLLEIKKQKSKIEIMNDIDLWDYFLNQVYPCYTTQIWNELNRGGDNERKNL